MTGARARPLRKRHQDGARARLTRQEACHRMPLRSETKVEKRKKFIEEPIGETLQKSTGPRLHSGVST